MSGEFVPYDIVYCSSQDPHHPISQLVGHNHESVNFEERTCGWQSARNGKVPQMLVLRFPGNARLRQLKILSHEAKIASTVEVRVFSLPDATSFDVAEVPPFRTVRFAKLGAVEFSSNEHSHYRLKERKTVHVKADAYFLKLIFGRPFVNERNTAQQVGVYSIQCSGKVSLPISIHADAALVSSSDKWQEMERRASVATPVSQRNRSPSLRRMSECVRPNSPQSLSANSNTAAHDKSNNNDEQDQNNEMMRMATPSHKNERRPSLGNAAGAGGNVGGNNANRRKSMERRPSLSISNIGEGVKVSSDDIHINNNNNNNKNNDKRYVEGNRDRSRSPNAKDALGKERMVQGKNNNAVCNNAEKNAKLNRANSQGEEMKINGDKVRKQETPQVNSPQPQEKKKELADRKANVNKQTPHKAPITDDVSKINKKKLSNQNESNNNSKGSDAELTSPLTVAEATKRPAQVEHESHNVSDNESSNNNKEVERESIYKTDSENEGDNEKDEDEEEEEEEEEREKGEDTESDEDDEDKSTPVTLAHTKAQMAPLTNLLPQQAKKQTKAAEDGKAAVSNNIDKMKQREPTQSKQQPQQERGVKKEAANVKPTAKTTPRTRSSSKVTSTAGIKPATAAATLASNKHTNSSSDVCNEVQDTNFKESTAPVMTTSLDHSSDGTAFRSVKIVEFEAMFLSLTEQLLIRKEEAIAIEEFETASACRNMLQFLQSRAKRIYELEQEKVQAIIEENFVSAEHAKTAMDGLVEEIVRHVQIPPLMGTTIENNDVNDTSNESDAHMVTAENNKGIKVKVADQIDSRKNRGNKIRSSVREDGVNGEGGDDNSRRRSNNAEQIKSRNSSRTQSTERIARKPATTDDDNDDDDGNANINENDRRKAVQETKVAQNKRQQQQQQEPQEQLEEEEEEEEEYEYEEEEEEEKEEEEEETKLQSNEARKSKRSDGEEQQNSNEGIIKEKMMNDKRQSNDSAAQKSKLSPKTPKENERKGQGPNCRRSLDSINSNIHNNNLEDEPVRPRASRKEDAILRVRDLTGREKNLALAIMTLVNGEEEKESNEGSKDTNGNDAEMQGNNTESNVAKRTPRSARNAKDVNEATVENVDATQNTGQLVPTVGKFVTACLMSKRFKLREAALTVLTNELPIQFHGENRIQVAEAVLRFLDLSGFGLQDGIPNVVFASCSFVRMILSDDSHLPSALIAPLSTLLSRLLTRAADNLARIRDEALMTLAAYVQTSAITNSILINAVLADPTDLDRRTRPVTNPKVQVARLSVLQMLVEQDRINSDVASGSAILNKLLIPCANHQNQGVRDIACGLLKALTSAHKLTVREADIRRINNNAIREMLEATKQPKQARTTATTTAATAAAGGAAKSRAAVNNRAKEKK